MSARGFSPAVGGRTGLAACGGRVRPGSFAHGVQVDAPRVFARGGWNAGAQCAPLQGALQRDPVPFQVDALPRFVEGILIHPARRQDGTAADLVLRFAGDEHPVKAQRPLAEIQRQPELLLAVPLPPLTGPDGAPRS